MLAYYHVLRIFGGRHFPVAPFPPGASYVLRIVAWRSARRICRAVPLGASRVVFVAHFRLAPAEPGGAFLYCTPNQN